MKRLSILFSIIFISIILAGCADAEPTPTLEPAAPVPVSVFPLSLTDDAGNLVVIDQVPEKVVSLAPSHTETLYALGLGDSVVGVTEYCNYPPEAAEKTKVGGYSNIDLEQVVGLDPDLVIASTLHVAEIVPGLKERGLTVFVCEPQTLQGVLESTLTIGHIMGKDDAAKALVSQMEQRILAVQDTIKDAPKPRVFWELGPELYTAGPGSFVNDLIISAGGENVASDADSQWPQLSLEAIVLKDPEVVVLADHNYGETSELLKQRPGWLGISAVKEGRVLEITDDDIVSRPGPRIVDGLELLAKTFHPDKFE